MVNETFFHTDLPYLLRYQVYEDAYPENQLYWIEAAGSTCQAVNALGIVTSVSCDIDLPALCTQSATYGASPESANLLAVQSNDLTITGYVGFPGIIAINDTRDPDAFTT